MTYYQTPDGKEAFHIGSNPEVGKEVYRVGDELVYTDADGCVAGFPVITKMTGHCLVLFCDGTWRKYDNEDEMTQETAGQDIETIMWTPEAV